VTQDGIAAKASSGLEAKLATAELSSPQFQSNCPSVKCSITCDSGLGHTQYFTSALACYSYSDESGCHSSGFYVCSEKPAVAGC
jgi:hypothetical protein